MGMAWASVTGVATWLIGGFLCFRDDFFLIPSTNEWRRLFAFGSLASGGAILQEIGISSPSIVVGRMLSIEGAGIYSRGCSLITLFEQVLIGSISAVAQSALADLKRNGKDVAEPYLRYLGTTTAIAWPILALMNVLALPIILVPFGSQWLAAVPVAHVICLVMMLIVPVGTGYTLLSAIGAVRRLFWINVISLPILIAGLALGSLYGLAGAAWGQAIAGIIGLGVTLDQVSRAAQVARGRLVAAMAPSALVAAASVLAPLAVVHWLGISPDHFWVPSLLASTVGSASWLGILFIIGHPLCDEILVVLRKLGQLSGLRVFT
jgi:O-antigen/teichoic acid export membrane protein